GITGSRRSALIRALRRFLRILPDQLLEIGPVADRREGGVGLEGLRVGEPAPGGAAKELEDTVAVFLAAEPIALAQLVGVEGALRPFLGADQRDAERHVARQPVALTRVELGQALVLVDGSLERSQGLGRIARLLVYPADAVVGPGQVDARVDV